MTPLKVIMIGTAYPLRGGLAAYNERLARAFQAVGDTVQLHTFSLQYPRFLFPGKSQYSTSLPPSDLHIRVWINSINPFNWIRVGIGLRKEKPDVIVIKFWLPFMGACFGTILRIVRWKRPTRVICIADNIIPHEKRPGDRWLTRYFMGSCDAFITMSDKVQQDLMSLSPNMPSLRVEHPLYDHFGEPLDRTAARKHLGLPLDARIVLFFGFIRKYKGLDLLLEAIKILQDRDPGDGQMPVFLIAGEFYEDAQSYVTLIDQLHIRERLILRTEFIADEEVKYYMCAGDVVIQPYRNATQSGVTPLAYHFNCPMIVTNVGGLADIVPDGKVGVVCQPDPFSIAGAIDTYFRLGRAHFLPYLLEEKKKYSWTKMVDAIKTLAYPVA
jgi:glycosyltransferase involved in cell wall biosynthesis